MTLNYLLEYAVMTKILVLNSSVQGDASVSRKLVDEAVAALDTDSRTTVLRRDVVEDALPHLSPEAMAALRLGQDASPDQKQALALSDALVAELQAADIVVIGAPMYNFGMPSQLKAWFDHVLRSGITFRYTEQGPEGLLKGKRALVVETRGGFYSEGPAAVMDAQEPHLRGMLTFMGITDVTFIRAERLAMGAELANTAIVDATAGIHAFADGLRVAA